MNHALHEGPLARGRPLSGETSCITGCVRVVNIQRSPSDAPPANTPTAEAATSSNTQPNHRPYVPDAGGPPSSSIWMRKRIPANINRLLKDAICGHTDGVTLRPTSWQSTACTPHSSGFVRLACHHFSPTCTGRFQRVVQMRCRTGLGFRLQGLVTAARFKKREQRKGIFVSAEV